MTALTEEQTVGLFDENELLLRKEPRAADSVQFVFGEKYNKRAGALRRCAR
jgi:hypothetical protein